MKNKQFTFEDLLIETHIGLERQGFGSRETTLKALSFIDNPGKITRAADLACGTGGQTMVLAEHIPGSIVGVDICSVFIDVLNCNAEKLNLSEKIEGIVGDITNLSFEQEEFDLIWSEGAIDAIGFEKGLKNWHGFLKKDGYVAVSCPSWLTVERPVEVANMWIDAGSSLDCVEMNIEAMQRAGYAFVSAFTLPESDLTDNYFIPREKAGKAILENYPENETVKEYLAGDKFEAELYAKYKQHYGYVFYIGRKVAGEE